MALMIITLGVIAVLRVLRKARMYSCTGTATTASRATNITFQFCTANTCGRAKHRLWAVVCV